MLQETFAEWAQLGNGQYFNARDGAELAASLRGSIEVAFTVLDASGAVVATGTVNGPAITLDAGSYRIVAESNPPRSIEAVVVGMDEETSVALPAE